MPPRELGIILHGATGRIASTQHLANALAPIIAEGGLGVGGGETVMPKLLLAGRNEVKLADIARAHNLENWTTDLDVALADDAYPVFFEAAATHLRLPLLRRAIAAGKHIYSEKPVAPSVKDGLAILAAGRAKGLKMGTVEDKIYSPGYRKIAKLVEDGFFGRVVNFRLDFGWWVFDGLETQANRPSWNYQKSGGGGLFPDMFTHWRYVIESMVGPMARIVAAGWTAQPRRADEAGRAFDVDVEDSCSVIVELESGAFGTIMSSWAQRVIGDDLVSFQIDGTGGSAVAGMRRCRAQGAKDTPDIRGFNLGGDASTLNYNVDHAANWHEVPEAGPYVNLYREGWEQFIRHVVSDAPLISDYAAGIRDVQFAEACLQSSETATWVSMAPLG
jgi:predicted dehydrogenase